MIINFLDTMAEIIAAMVGISLGFIVFFLVGSLQKIPQKVAIALGALLGIATACFIGSIPAIWRYGNIFPVAIGNFLYVCLPILGVVTVALIAIGISEIVTRAISATTKKPFSGAIYTMTFIISLCSIVAGLATVLQPL